MADPEPSPLHVSATEGKYDAEVAAILQLVDGAAVMLIVKDGRQGDGFSLAIDGRRVSPDLLVLDIPRVLRNVADSIESENRERARMPGNPVQ